MEKCSFPITLKILLMFLAVVIPILIFFSVSYESDRKYLEARELVYLRTITNAREDDVLMFLEMKALRIRDLAADPFIKGEAQRIAAGEAGEAPVLERYLVDKRLPALRDIYILSVISWDGRVMASTAGPEAGGDASREEFFKNAKKGISVAEKDVGYMGGPELAFTAPIYSRGAVRPIGLVAGFVPMRKFQRVINGEYARDLGGAPVRPKGIKELEVVLVNKDRLLLTESGFVKDSALKQRADTRPVSACLERNEDITGVFRDYRGVEVVGASLCFPAFKWTLVVKADKKDLFAPAFRMRRHALLTVVTTSVSMGLLVFLFLSVVVRQIRRVSAAAGRIAAGDYNISIPVRSNDEIGVLSESFNNMARSVNERDASLKVIGDRLVDQVNFLQVLMDTIPSPIFYKDANGVCLGCNRAFETASGIKRDDLAGRTAYDVWPVELADKCTEMDSELFSNPGVGTYESEVRYADGCLHNIIFNKATYFKSGGVLAGLVGIMTDITGRKKAEDEVKKNLELLQGLIDTTKTVIFIRDTSDRYMFVNRQVETITGLPKEKIIGKTPYDIFPKETADELTAASIKVLESGVPMEFEVKVPVEEGVRLFIQEMSPIFNDKGEIFAVSGISTDITARKHMEEALRESEANLANAQRIAHSGSWRWDLAQKKVYSSHELYRILGVSKGELVTPEAFIGRLVHPEDRESVKKAIENALIGKKPYSLEYRIIRPDGKERILRSEAEVSFDDMERPRSLAGIVQDITELKRLEAEREKMQAQMFQDQKMKAIGELAGGIAHDFNNLIIIIKMNSALAMKEVHEESALSLLRQISETSDRAANLTKQLLIFSRSLPAEITILNMNLVVNEMLKMLNRLIREDIFIKTGLDPGLWAIRGDKGTIEQVILNLVINARDAMPAGGDIFIRTENVSPSAKDCAGMPGARPGNFICLTIADTGMGMEKDVIRRIFEPFFTTKGGRGTGLGLAVVHGAVKDHNGWISVSSEPGRGSAFRIYLPALSKEVVSKDTAETGAGESRGNGERVMVIEDERWLRRSIALVLSKSGYMVFEAADAKEAMEIFEKEKGDFDLVFADIVLKNGSGLDLFNELASGRPGLRALFTSGYMDAESQWPAIRERGLSFLQKPYDTQDLLRAIRKAMDSRSA